MHKNKSIGSKNRAFKSLSTYSLNDANKDKTMELLEEYSSRGNNDSLLDGALFE
jgi:hypothetical protein